MLYFTTKHTSNDRSIVTVNTEQSPKLTTTQKLVFAPYSTLVLSYRFPCSLLIILAHYRTMPNLAVCGTYIRNGLGVQNMSLFLLKG